MFIAKPRLVNSWYVVIVCASGAEICKLACCIESEAINYYKASELENVTAVETPCSTYAELINAGSCNRPTGHKGHENIGAETYFVGDGPASALLNALSVGRNVHWVQTILRRVSRIRIVTVIVKVLKNSD